MTQRTIILLLGILLLGAFLRLWQLGNIPEGFYSDEALYGYEAYSLIKTGRDQFGNPWSLSIAGFGDFRPAVYIYSTIPSIYFLGLNEFATRLPSALFSIGTLLGVFLLSTKLTRNSKAALFSTFIMAISPWSLYFGRMAHETNLSTLLIIIGTIFLIYARVRPNYLILAMCAFATSFYTYHSGRVFVPLFLLITLVIFHHYLKKHRILILRCSVLLIFLSLPLIREFQTEAGWSRVRGISLWSDPGVVLRINELRGGLQKKGVDPKISRILYNKATVYPQVFTKNMLTHFNSDFLLLKGDPNGIYNTPNTGILLWIEPILIFLGGIYLYRNKRKVFWWMFVIVLVALVPDSLTKVAPSSARIHLVLPFISTLGGVGLWILTKRFKSSIVVIALLIIINSQWFWHNYLVRLPIENARAWQLGTKEMILKAEEFSPNFDKIWISRSGWGWIHILFHTEYDPETFQREVKVSERNELGFWWVGDVGKYHLEWLPEPLVIEPSTLYIGTPDEFPTIVKPFYVIRDSAGDERFWFVRTTHQ